MSEFAEELEHKRTTPTQPVSKRDDEPTTRKRAASKPGDSVLTTWLASHRAATNTGAHASGAEQAGGSTTGHETQSTAQAIITGYHAAQHALESSKSPDVVRAHLVHVSVANQSYDRVTDVEAVTAAADGFEVALRDRSHAKPGAFQELDEINQGIRESLALGAPHDSGRSLRGGSDASYAKAAIPPALDALAMRTRSSLEQLEQYETDDQSGRMRSIELISGDVALTSEYVKSLLAQLSPEERHSFAGATARAAQSILKIMHWVRERPTHAELKTKLMRGVAEFDAMSVAVGAERIGDRDEVPLSEKQMSSAHEEQAQFKQAMGEALGAIEHVAKIHRANIATFRGIAMLDDLPQPDFKAALLEAIIETALSAMIGHFAKVMFAAKVPTVAGSVAMPQAASAVSLPAPPGAKGYDAISNIFTIGVGAVKSAVKSTMGKPPGGEVDPVKLGAHYFCRALSVAEEARETAYQDNLRSLEAGGTVTVTELRELTHRMQQQTQGLGDAYIREITTAWATYLAQSHLGTKHVGNKTVADMNNYFGEKSATGREFGTSKAGGNGVLHVLMKVDEGGAKPHVERAATRIVGFNSELKGFVLESADYQLDRVDLPKEIHVQAGFARATIALDENNHVRDAIDWDEMKRYVGGVSAHRFWQLWGRNVKV